MEGEHVAALVPSVRAALQEIDRDQPLVNVRTMEQAIGDSVAQPRLQTLLLTLFAGVAVVLAIVGVYGVMAYAVSQRTQEIGVRIALGASRADVVRMVVAQGARLAAAGIVIGLVGAAAATRALQSLLFETERSRSVDLRRGAAPAGSGSARRELPAGAARRERCADRRARPEIGTQFCRARAGGSQFHEVGPTPLRKSMAAKVNLTPESRPSA